jgi:topoisomerase IV subunit B
MGQAHRQLHQVRLPDRCAADNKERKAGRETTDLVESLMRRKPEHRFEYIQANAQFVRDIHV